MAISQEQYDALKAAGIPTDTLVIQAAADPATLPPAPAVAASTVTAPLPAATPSVPADGGVAALLASVQAESVKHQLRAGSLENALAALTDKHTLMSAEHAKLAVIVRGVVGGHAVALGGTRASVDILAVSDLIPKHAETLAAYEKAFPIGGVAQPIGSAGSEAAAPKVDAMFLHVLANAASK